MNSIVTFLCVVCFTTFIQANPVHIDRIEMCDPKKDYPIKWTTKLKEENGIQILEEGNLSNRVEMGDNILNQIKIFSWGKDKWNFLISKEDDYCKLIRDFVGDFATELEKAAGLTTTCPYAIGQYNVKNFMLDFTKFKYKSFPNGKVKLVSEFNDKGSGEQLGCIEAEFTLTG